MGRPRKPRCVECGGIIRSKSKTYKGDLCEKCKKLRTDNNKKKYDESNPGRGKQKPSAHRAGALERAIFHNIMDYGLSVSIRREIAKKVNAQFEAMTKAMMNKAERIARRESRKTTYQILMHLGVQALGSGKPGKARLTAKVLQDMDELLDLKPKKKGKP